MSNEIILAVISLVSAVISGFLLYKTNTLKEGVKERGMFLDADRKFRDILLKEVDDLIARIKNLEETIGALRDELNSAEQKIFELEKIISSQFNKIKILELYCKNIPGPTWLKRLDKDNHLRMLFVNNKYTEVWGTTDEYYKDKTDYEVWPEEIANKFKEGDELVIQYKRGQKLIEVIPNNPEDANSGEKTWIVWKFPVMDDCEIIGIGGIAVDCEELEEAKDFYA